MATHEVVEKNAAVLAVFIVIVVAIGGLVEIVPLFFLESTTKPIDGLKPYTALELEGRDIYIREGCYVCHSQMVRPFRAETERYGHYSVAGEFVYDHPFQWGSKRTGPDLARVGTRGYGDEWHRLHLIDPRAVVPESNMPGFPWLAEREIDASKTADKMRTMNQLIRMSCSACDTYSEAQIANARSKVEGKTELDALVAYLQGLGTTLKRAR